MGLQKIFKIYSIVFLLIFMIILCVCFERFPTISESIAENVLLNIFFILNIIIISILFYIEYCILSKPTIFHYLLFIGVAIMVIFDCKKFRIMHYLGGLIYLVCVFIIICIKREPIYLLCFLILPIVAFGCLGLFEILFLILIALLIWKFVINKMNILLIFLHRPTFKNHGLKNI